MDASSSFPDYLTDSVERFAIQADGTLAPLGSTPLELHNPLSVRITPDGRFAVFVNAPSSPGETKIQSLAIGSDGSLTSTGPALATTGDSTSAATITPNGRFAYVGNGNEDSITGYSIGPSGVLTQLGVPTPAGLDSPDALGISNDGHFLYASDSHGEEIQAFSIGADGALIKIGTPVSTGGESDGSAIVARPAVPVASLAPVVPRIEPGKRVTFNASGSHDVGAAITGYSWNFGDGASAETPGPTTGHAYKPGVYTVSVTVKDADGCSGFVYTGQTAYCNGNAATASLTVDTVPVIQGMTATPKRFPTLAKVHSAGISVKGKKRRGGTTFHYKLTETARVSVAIQRKLSGRKVGKACKRPTKANAKKRKCVRLKPLGSLVAKGKAGKNKLRFSGKLRGKPLPPGRYLATATAIDSATGKSTPRSTSFEVLPPR